MCLKTSFKMASKKVLVTLDKKTVKVTCSTFNSLLNGTKSKFNLSADAFHLEYFDDNSNKWITLCDDEDMEDVSTNTEIRIILKEAVSDASSSGGNNIAYYGNAQYVGGNVTGTMAGRDHFGGDNIKGGTVVKVNKQEGNIKVGEKKIENQFKGPVSGGGVIKGNYHNYKE